MPSSIPGFAVVLCLSIFGAQGGDGKAKNLERCWTELASSDAMLAFKAMGEMIEMPKDSVTFLGTKLQPVPGVDPAMIDKLVAELDSANFAAREKATKELEKLGGLAKPALEKVLAKPPSAEAETRAKKLKDALEGPVTSPDELRAIRSVEVLERIGTGEARDLVVRLAKGAPGARLTSEASKTLTRLKK